MKKKSNNQLKIVLAVVLVAVLILLPLFQVIGLINVFEIFAVSDYHTGIHPSTINELYVNNRTSLFALPLSVIGRTVGRDRLFQQAVLVIPISKCWQIQNM